MSLNGKNFQKGSFGFDVSFMNKRQKVVLLSSADSLSQVMIFNRISGKGYNFRPAVVYLE